MTGLENAKQGFSPREGARESVHSVMHVFTEYLIRVCPVTGTRTLAVNKTSQNPCAHGLCFDEEKSWATCL